MVEIRRAGESDFEAIWPVFREVVARGDAYVMHRFLCCAGVGGDPIVPRHDR